jgi:hypothetical protein
MYLAGHQLQALYLVGMVQERQGIMITVASYLDNVSIGLVSDPNLVPDLWGLLDKLTDALDELSGLAAAV